MMNRDHASLILDVRLNGSKRDFQNEFMAMKILGVVWVASAFCFFGGAVYSITKHDVRLAALYATIAVLFVVGSWGAFTGRLTNRRFHLLERRTATHRFCWSGLLVMLFCGILNLAIAIERWRNGETWSASVYIALSLLTFGMAVRIFVDRPKAPGDSKLECPAASK